MPDAAPHDTNEGEARRQDCLAKAAYCKWVASFRSRVELLLIALGMLNFPAATAVWHGGGRSWRRDMFPKRLSDIFGGAVPLYWVRLVNGIDRPKRIIRQTIPIMRCCSGRDTRPLKRLPRDWV